jgi:hypothetical protein
LFLYQKLACLTLYPCDSKICSFGIVRLNMFDFSSSAANAATASDILDGSLYRNQ